MKPVEVSLDGGENEKKPCVFRKRKYLLCDTACGCCCCGCAGVSLLIVIVAFIAALAQTFPATKFTNVKYDVDGTTLHAYLATPKDRSNKKSPSSDPLPCF